MPPRSSKASTGKKSVKKSARKKRVGKPKQKVKAKTPKAKTPGNATGRNVECDPRVEVLTEHLKNGRRVRKCPHGYRVSKCGCAPTLNNIMPYQTTPKKAFEPNTNTEQEKENEEEEEEVEDEDAKKADMLAQSRYDVWKNELNKNAKIAQSIGTTPAEEKFLEKFVPLALSGLSQDPNAMKLLTKEANATDNRIAEDMKKKAGWGQWAKNGIRWVAGKAKRVGVYVLGKVWDLLTFLWNRSEIVLLVSLIILWIKREVCKKWSNEQPILKVKAVTRSEILYTLLNKVSTSLGDVFHNITEIGGWIASLSPYLAAFLTANHFLGPIVNVILQTTVNLLLSAITKFLQTRITRKAGSLGGAVYVWISMILEECIKNFRTEVSMDADSISSGQRKDLERNWNQYENDAILHANNTGDSLTKSSISNFVLDRAKGKIRNEHLYEYGMSAATNNEFVRANQLEKSLMISRGPSVQTFRPDSEYRAKVLYPVRDAHAQHVQQQIDPWINIKTTMETSSEDYQKIIDRVESIPYEDRTPQEDRARSNAILELSRRNQTIPWRELWARSTGWGE